MEQSPQLNDVIVAIERFSRTVEDRFDIVDDRFGLIEDRCKVIQSAMVTRDHLDERLLSLRSDFTLQIRREDVKLNALVDVLHRRSILNGDDRAHLMAMGPFPQA